MAAYKLSRTGVVNFLVLSVIGIVLLANVLIPNGSQGEELLLAQARQFFKPLPKDMATPEFPITPELAELGRVFFFDPRLSLDGTVSCARCHQPSLYGTDALPKSVGVENRPNPRNAPTILNAALQFAAHWYGDRTSVEDQAAKSVLGKASFGNPDFVSVEAKIKAIPSYGRELDKGRYSVTNDAADMFVFKVPGLRNESMTPSYFHDGSVGTLSQAIRLMADLQTGRKLSDQEVESMVQFFEALPANCQQTSPRPLRCHPLAFKEDNGGILAPI